jgi:DNA recombination protein RmuC
MLLISSICLQVLVLIVLVRLWLWAKKLSSEESPKELRDLRDAFIRLESKSVQVDQSLRSGIQEIRAETNAVRELLAQKLQALSDDMGQRYVGLSEAINAKLNVLQQEITDKIARGQNIQSDQTLKMKETVENTLGQLGRDIRENVRLLTEEVKNRLQEVSTQLASVSVKNEEKQNALRETVEGRLEKLQESNNAKLEEMRITVDEKLHTTLERRLTESFGLVTDQLGKVQTGLGEMKELATGVGDLKRVLTNVKARGGLGEVMLGTLLDQALTPDQYIKNARIKPNSQESVEYAIRIPNGDREELLLPIDAKFPKEDWERLEDATQHGSAEEIAAARKALESTIKTEAKKISEKYIYPPTTVPFAFMFLSTEGLFAEVVRIPGLVSDLHTKFRVSIAGPTTFMAMLSSLQMGFRTVALQRKGAEVWQVLAAAKLEFGNFGKLMTKVEGQVNTVQNTLSSISKKTKTINSKLKSVDTLEMEPLAAAALLDINVAEDEDSKKEKIVEIAATSED